MQGKKFSVGLHWARGFQSIYPGKEALCRFIQGRSTQGKEALSRERGFQSVDTM